MISLVFVCLYLNEDAKKQAILLIKSLYKMFVSTDANMVEVNPLILTKEEKIVCLDAKVNFDSNAYLGIQKLLN